MFRAQHPFKPEYQSDLVLAKQAQQRERCRSKTADVGERCTKYEGYEDAKKRKLLEASMQLDVQKMECTFKPRLTRSAGSGAGGRRSSQHDDKIVIAGWDRFKELKLLSLKKHAESEQREHEVFSVNCKMLKAMGCSRAVVHKLYYSLH